MIGAEGAKLTAELIPAIVEWLKTVPVQHRDPIALIIQMDFERWKRIVDRAINADVSPL